ncbi:hypothetical protein C8A01DRAFT_35121 [Parachaetomium inaequale]|uniref:C2H2-type domain-containing protein n=1 Tax=Parachaetomium inaequale TaxID=2588326 RepID=A0AAN6PJ03_9PEZI|nr:hypothetical protein C8A01DRAFT_35121 [Parachaetomium inaequale]
MAPFRHYTAPPYVPNGIQDRADCGIPSPTSPPPYPYSSHDYEPHDPRECVHVRLCDQRYADLRASMADLERSQCRCGRSTWSRLTKSLFGSLKERARSLMPRGKPQDSTDSEHEPDYEWPGKLHPSSWPEELPAVSRPRPAELGPSPAFKAELAAASSAGYYFNGAPGPGPACPPAYAPYAHGYGYGQKRFNSYELDSGIAPQPRMTFGHPPTQVSRPHELAAQVPHLTTPRYPNHAMTTFTNLSHLAPSTMSPGGSDFVSPQSSISSVSSLPGATTAAVPGAPLFATHTTSSPVEYDGGVAPWNAQQPRPHQNSWDSTATAVELPDSSPGPMLGTAQWLQNQPSGPVPELEGTVPFMKPTVSPLGQSFGEMQPMQPLELPANANTQVNMSVNDWQLSQMMAMDKHPMLGTPGIHSSYFHPPPPPSRPGPRPLVSQSRIHSYDSTASTVLDVVMSDDYISIPHTPETLYTPQTPHRVHPEFPRPQQPELAPQNPYPPSAPSPATPAPIIKKRKAHPKQQHHHHPRQQQQPQDTEPTSCRPCDFHPTDPGRRRKLANHYNTDRHRRNTGQDKAERVACGECGATFNREDNMWQHDRKEHEGRGRRRGRGARGRGGRS